MGVFSMEKVPLESNMDTMYTMYMMNKQEFCLGKNKRHEEGKYLTSLKKFCHLIIGL